MMLSNRSRCRNSILDRADGVMAAADVENEIVPMVLALAAA